MRIGVRQSNVLRTRTGPLSAGTSTIWFVPSSRAWMATIVRPSDDQSSGLM